MAKQKTDADSVAKRIARECVAFRVQLLNRVISRLYDEALQPLGVTMNQMCILTVLENMGEAQPGAVGAYLRMDKSTVSRAVKLMRQRKWVAENPGADARSVLLVVTEKGRALIAKALPLWERSQAQARELLGGDGASAESITVIVDRFVLPAK